MSDEGTEMVCDELVTLVTDYLEGTLSESDRMRFERHVADCDWCSRYLEQTRGVVATLGRVGEESPDAETLERALRAFRDARA